MTNSAAKPMSTEPKDANAYDHVERVVPEGEGTGKDYVDVSRVDKELQQYAGEVVHIDETTNKRLRRQIDKRVLAVMVVTYLLQCLDKSTLGFSSIMGIREYANLENGQKYSWLSTCIYIAVLIVEYPTNWIVQRVPIAKYLGINICLWGSVLALHAACKNFTSLIIVRTLLGIFEAVCQPCFVLLSSMWYRREEQAQAVTYWVMMNGVQQIIGGLLAYCFSLIGNDHTIKSFQVLFMTYGCISVAWGLFVIWWMPDSPMRAKCWNEEDKRLMVERVRSNQTGLQNRKFRVDQLWEAVQDPQVYCYMAIQIFATIPASGVAAFANIIISGFHFSVLQTQLLSMVMGFYTVVILLSSSFLVGKTGQNMLVMLAYLIPSYAGTIALMAVENKTMSTKIGLLFSYYITLSFWAVQNLGLSLVSRNIGGATKKSVVIAATFACWAAGSAIGPQIFLDRDAPRYFIAFSVHLGCYASLSAVMLFLRWYLASQNKKKERMLMAAGLDSNDQNLQHAFEDRTDQENLHFRYVY